jgi:hypothetical protein
VASNGDGFFAVWSDSRSGSAVLFGSRISRDGSLLDGPGIRLFPYGGDARVIWNGRRYLVVLTTQSSQELVSIIAVDEDGRVAPAQDLIRTNRNPGNIALATNGDSTLLVTEHLGAVLIDASGRKIRDVDVPGPSFDAASDGHDYMIVTASRFGVVSRLVSAAGDVASPQPITTDDSSFAAIGFGHDRYLVAWTTNMTLRAAPLGTDGSLGAGHVVATSTPPATYLARPHLIWRSGEYLAIAGSSGIGPVQYYTVRLASDGTPLELPSETFSNDWQPPDAAAATDGTALVTTTNPLAAFVLAPHVARSLTAHPIAIAPPSQYDTAVASIGSDPLIAWREGLTIHLRRGNGPPSWPSGAAGKGKLLLLTSGTNSGDLSGLLCDRAGEMMPVPFTLASATFDIHDLAAVWTGSDFVVGWLQSLGPWIDGGLPPPSDDIHLAHVSASGAVGVPVTIAYGQAAGNLKVAALGADLAVAWQYYGWSPGTFGGILGCVVQSGLPATVHRWAEAATFPTLAGLVARRDNYLLVWSEMASNVELGIAHRLIDRYGNTDEIARLPQFPRFSSLALFAGSIGTSPFLIYNRPVEETPFNGAPRLYIRLADPSLRLRTVR